MKWMGQNGTKLIQNVSIFMLRKYISFLISSCVEFVPKSLDLFYMTKSNNL